MKNKKLLTLVLSILIVFSSITNVFAATFDLYHRINLEDDVDLYYFLKDPIIFRKVYYDVDNYLQKHLDGKYYSFKEIDEEMKKGSDNTSEAIKNLDAYIEIRDNTESIENLDNKLEEFKANESSDFYTIESWNNYSNARLELDSIKSKRFEKEKVVEEKIKSLENAYNALETAIVDKEELINTLKQAKTRKKENYTIESFQALENAISNGENVLNNERATKEEVENAIKDLKTAIAGLVEKSKIVHIINPESITVTKGSEINLPEKVTVVYEDEKREEKSVLWNPEIADTSVEGEFKYTGTIEGTELKATLNLIVVAGIDKSKLQETINEAQEKLNEDITNAEREKLLSGIEVAKSVLGNSTLQEEINTAESELREILNSILGNPKIENLKPDVNVNIQPGQSVKISFDSQSGGVANYEVSMPMRRSRRSLKIDSNMQETSPGHYEGAWSAPEGIYGEGFSVKVSFTTRDGVLITETATGKINITNEYTVSYMIGNDVIGTEALKFGEKPKNVPTPEKAGYTFSHWELENTKVNPENVEIVGNTTFVAVMNPIGDLFATVEYLDDKGNSLMESKTIENLGFGSELTEDAPIIEGYYTKVDQISIIVGMGNNKITFEYLPKEDIPYTIKYISNEEEIKESQIGRGVYRAENNVEIPEIPGYTPVSNSAKILLDKLEGNEISLEYIPRTDIPYTIKHVQLLNNGSEKILNTSTKVGVYKDTVTENAVKYPGLVVDEESKTIELTSLDNNEIIFEYRERTDLYYTINYENRQGETWTKTIPANFNETVTKEAVQGIAVENNGQDYKIEAIDKDEITIDDRVENNVFNVSVFKIYPLDKHQDLKNLLDDANSIIKPAYANNNNEWTNYWQGFENARNEYRNTLLTEDNLEVLKSSLEDNIEIIKIISDFDSAWKDRFKPKGFEKTMNDQAQSPDVYGRFQIYYNQYTNTIKVGMSEEQQGKTFAAGAISVGLKTAMLNVLNSDNLYTVESKGIVAEIRTPDGVKKSDSELQTEGLKLAKEWLPEGANPFKNTWGELIGTPPVDFIMNGKTSNGTEVKRSYTFEFIDKKDI